MKTLLLAFAATVLSAAEPVRIIFDTDMGNDIDDALALAMLHAFESRADAKLLGVTLTKDNVWAARFVSAVDTFYNRGQVPIGMVAGGKTKDDGKYCRETMEPGRYPHSGRTTEAVTLLRKLLTAEPDQSVVLVQVGFSTNLARLLASSEDRALVSRKVRLLSLMGGDFERKAPEYNIKTDIPAAQRLFSEWPTPIVASGYEVGRTIKFPARSIEQDFAWVKDHPVAEAYRHYMKMPYDRETWDLTSVLYAVHPDRGYFDLSPPGRITVEPDGNTTFTPDTAGRHRYLIVNGTQRARILEAFIYLASQPRQ